MANIYKIVVTNASPEPQMLYFFQQPAGYTGGPVVYSNSLGSMQLPPAQPGATSQIEFCIEPQFYAGAQSQPQPIVAGQSNLTSLSAVAINVEATGANENDCTTMSISDGSSLPAPTYIPGVEPGAFRITTPVFDPAITSYNTGLAALAQGNVVLSSFVTANPSRDFNTQPIVRFYVSTGNYTPGTVFNFDSSSQTAALCDGTNGQDFFVTYNANETWTVSTTPPPETAA